MGILQLIRPQTKPRVDHVAGDSQWRNQTTGMDHMADLPSHQTKPNQAGDHAFNSSTN
jgi:hypothetical protein